MSFIELQNVSVDYPIYNAESRSLKQHFMRLSTGGSIYQKNSHRIVRGLDNLSFKIEHGDKIGLIGHNGAGKSTLLRTLAGIYEPTAGKITVEGEISSLFNIMLGFDDDATGLENITIRSVLMGMPRSAISRISEEVTDFAELGDYLHMPVRTYSAGMRLRLAFAIATSIHPEILLIDEVVSVGDTAFIQKAQARLNNLINRSSILVLAAHSDSLIREFCNKVIWMKAGKLMFYGDVKEGLKKYRLSIKNR